MTPKGYRHLVKVPKRVGDRMAMIPGDYVVIQSTEKGERYLAEVIRVIDNEHEIFYREHNIWPKEYDIAGYVERLAEKVRRAEEAAERDKKLIKQQRKRDRLCGTHSDTTGSDISKKKKKKDIKCKKAKKFEKNCLASSPLFADDGLPLNFEDDENSKQRNNCTNTGAAISNSTNTGQLKINTRQFPNPAVSSESSCCTSGCCSKSCCGRNSAKLTRTVGTGPYWTRLVASRDKLPPLYGKCTPWRVTAKELKKKCKQQYY